MTGLEIAEAYYRAFGEKMISEEFPELKSVIAVGLIGSGSECYGYDDELSRDHDFEPGFTIFLPPEEVVDRRTAFRLERSYHKLPDEFMGLKRNKDVSFDAGRKGIVRAADFFLSKVGNAEGDLSIGEWIKLPEHYLLEATNGKIFSDELGLVTDVRKKLAFFPEDVRLKKLAGCLTAAEQAANYNYERLLLRCDLAGAQLAIVEYVKHAMHAAFLLEKRYMPYYKWTFRAFIDLPTFASLKGDFERLLMSGNGVGEAILKRRSIHRVNAALGEEIRRQSLSDYEGLHLDSVAHCVNAKIKDPSLRNAHLMAGV